MQFNEKEILTNSGKITAALAKEFAEQEYEKYRIIQDRNYISDFDREIEKIKQLKDGESKKNSLDFTNNIDIDKIKI